jgi:hypothetical protein
MRWRIVLEQDSELGRVVPVPKESLAFRGTILLDSARAEGNPE